MVAEVPAHAGQLVVHGDAHLAQVVGGSDARQQQQLGGADGAAAQDDLVPLDGEYLTAALDLDAHRSW